LILSEILDEYKDSDDKRKIIKEFTNSIWKSKYRFKTYTKYYTYKVKENSLGNREDLIDLFNKYKVIEFTFCKSYFTKRMNPADYIRIHINNMYGFLVNKEVYLPKEYYKILLTPRDEYFKAINMIKNNEDIDCDEVRLRIESALNEAEQVKQIGIQKKLDIGWTDYKKLINTYIERIMNNYIPLHEYEQQHGWELNVKVDGWSEDNYIIRYFCKSLTGYLRNYVRDSKPKEVKQKKCKLCNKEIESNSNRQKFCAVCWKERSKELKRNWWNKQLF
jgi:hypothetical protein